MMWREYQHRLYGWLPFFLFICSQLDGLYGYGEWLRDYASARDTLRGRKFEYSHYAGLYDISTALVMFTESCNVMLRHTVQFSTVFTTSFD